MNPIFRRCCIVAVLLIPSLYALCRNLDVPKFCQWHDDCVYMVSAKSLTDGEGYRIMSLPGEPSQTKYPPLYPLLLSLAWRIQPSFPEALAPAAWLTWLPLPALLWMLVDYYVRLGFRGWRLWSLLATVAMSPYTLLFTTTLLSEALFAALLLGSLLLAERAAEIGDVQERKFALAAGLLMGLGYLARSSGIVAVVALPAFFFYRCRKRLTIPFLLGLLPVVIAWTMWAQIHQTHTSDPMLMYYVDYAGYEIYNVPLANIPLLLWKNMDGLIGTLGSMIMIKFSDSFLLKIVQTTLGIGVLAGLLRLARRGKGLSFVFFAAANSVLLLIWHFPPDPRFIFPLLPLILAAFWTEMEYRVVQFWAGLRHPKTDQRIAACALLATVVLTMGVSLYWQAFHTFFHLPRDGQADRVSRAAQTSAYEWFKQNTDPSTSVLTTLDPLFYMQTGRHAMRLTVPPIFWYLEDHASTIEIFHTLVPFAREHKLDYVYHAGVDFIWGVDDNDRPKIDQDIRSNQNLVTMFRDGESTVYKIRPTNKLVSSPDGASDDRIDQASRQHDH